MARSKFNNITRQILCWLICASWSLGIGWILLHVTGTLPDWAGGTIAGLGFLGAALAFVNLLEARYPASSVYSAGNHTPAHRTGQ